MQKNSGVKLSENEICMLVSGKERLVFPRPMNNPCLPYNGYEFVKCIPPTLPRIMTDESNAAILLGKKNTICVSKQYFDSLELWELKMVIIW